MLVSKGAHSHNRFDRQCGVAFVGLLGCAPIFFIHDYGLWLDPRPFDYRATAHFSGNGFDFRTLQPVQWRTSISMVAGALADSTHPSTPPPRGTSCTSCRCRRGRDRCGPLSGPPTPSSGASDAVAAHELQALQFLFLLALDIAGEIFHAALGGLALLLFRVADAARRGGSSASSSVSSSSSG